MRGKKLIAVILIMIFVTVNLQSIVLAETITLEQIVEKLNSSDYGEYFVADATGFSEPIYIDMQAEVLDNKIKVSGSLGLESNPSEKIEEETEYILSENILSITMNVLEDIDINTEKSMEIILLRSTLLMSVIDSVGQLNGYAKGETLELINQQEAANCTLEKEGIELKQLDEETMQVKLDLSKKLDLEVLKAIAEAGEDILEEVEEEQEKWKEAERNEEQALNEAAEIYNQYINNNLPDNTIANISNTPKAGQENEIINILIITSITSFMILIGFTVYNTKK